MGVGFAEDLVICCALGVDMFDCVFPTRTAVRFFVLLQTAASKFFVAAIRLCFNNDGAIKFKTQKVRKRF